MKIDIDHVAALAKLPLSKAEKRQHQKQLERIIDFVSEIDELETDGVEPTVTLPVKVNELREDQSKKGLKQKEALKNANTQKDGFFVTEGVFTE